MTATMTATMTSMRPEAISISSIGVATGNRSIVATMHDDRSSFTLELKIVAGKARATALLSWLRSRADGRSFNDLRRDAFAWCEVNPRGFRSGFVAPSIVERIC